jgi:hypothetical protein
MPRPYQSSDLSRQEKAGGEGYGTILYGPQP